MLPRTWTPEELSDPDRVAAEGYAAVFGGIPETRPRFRNGLAVRELNASGVFIYRGRRYLVPPLPYPAGAELMEMAVRVKEIRAESVSADSLAEVRDILTRCAALYHANARPMSFLRRLLKPFLANPFASMSEQEAGQLLDFFSDARMRSTVRAG